MRRLLPREALAAPRRRHIMEAVRGNPGVAFRELSRLIGLPPGTLRHHLNVLRRAQCIVERQHGARLCFFHAESDANWVETVLRREPALAVLLDWLKLNPRVPQSDVLLAMEIQGWSRSTTQHRLSRLVDGGAATVFLQGRFKLYSSATQPNPMANRTALPLEAAHASI